eukprot:6253100-Prymnesium_polylepis.1
MTTRAHTQHQLSTMLCDPPFCSAGGLQELGRAHASAALLTCLNGKHTSEEVGGRRHEAVFGSRCMVSHTMIVSRTKQ